jgi:hypothetical protein
MKQFKRDLGRKSGDNGIRMESDVLRAQASAMSIGELLGRLEDYSHAEIDFKKRYPWAKYFVCGYPIPKFQRDIEWTEADNVRFIRSIWAGIDIGSYLVNELQTDYIVRGKGDNFHYVELTDALLDGQQRLHAIERYVTCEFAVPDATGVPRYWSELPSVEKIRFARTTFTRCIIQTRDPELAVLAYEMRAFSGKPHSISEKQRVAAYRDAAKARKEPQSAAKKTRSNAKARNVFRPEDEEILNSDLLKDEKPKTGKDKGNKGKPADSDESIITLKLSDTKIIRAQMSEFRPGKPALDIRAFYLDQEDGQWKPTKQGVQIPMQTGVQFHQAENFLQDIFEEFF